MEWEWNRSRDGMGMEWEGGPTGLGPSHLPPSQRAGVTGSLTSGSCGRRQHHSSLWSVPCPCEQSRSLLGNST